jgi:1-acyl-sn-glycerol-3-phosphate acyltransferase
MAPLQRVRATLPGVEPVYRPVIGVALSLFKVMNWRVLTTGTEHIPTTGPAVIATNHIGYLDFVFVGYGARERGRLVRFMAKEEIFKHKIAGPLMRGMKHIPADRFGQAGVAIQHSIAALKRGEVVGMFPEGTISRSFVPAEGKTGAARIAIETGAALIPGAVWGTQRILTKGRPKNFQRNLAITVDFGPPVNHEPGDDPRVVTKEVMERIASLADFASKRYPQQPSGPDDDWWLPAHLGGSAPTVEASLALSAQEKAERAAKAEQALDER